MLVCSAVGCRSAARPASGPAAGATPNVRADSAVRGRTRRDTTLLGAARDSLSRVASASVDSVGGARASGPLPDPSTAVRFEIVVVGDSTFAFVAPTASWLTVGNTGIAVDPRRRDILVARFRVIARQADTATALITGQTTRLVTDHVALVARPPAPPVVLRSVEQRRFWAGAAVGAVFGVIAGLLVQH
jgi:hypothetical protein